MSNYNRPTLTFDDDGVPRVSIDDGNGGVASVRCSADGLAEFIAEVKTAIMRKTGDPELQRKVGKALIDILGKWVGS